MRKAVNVKNSDINFWQMDLSKSKPIAVFGLSNLAPSPEILLATLSKKTCKII